MELPIKRFYKLMLQKLCLHFTVKLNVGGLANFCRKNYCLGFVKHFESAFIVGKGAIK